MKEQRTGPTTTGIEEGLIHVESLDAHQETSQEAFDALIQKLLKRAPNCKDDGRALRRATPYNGEYPTDKEMSFRLGSSTITAEYYVSLGMPPRSKLSIATPIIVDNLARDSMSVVYPQEPIEYAEFESSPYYGGLDIRVEAKTRPGDHGCPILLDQYTAGGMLPPIQTEGRGKLEAFDNLATLLKDAKPRDLQYKRPMQRLAV